MKIQYYIRIEGEESRLQALGHDLAGKLDGNISRRRSTGYPLADSQLSYWMSKKIDSTIESLSCDLISFLQPVVELPHIDKGVRVTVVVVATCHEEGEQPGLYLAAELVHLMGKIGADLDYDVVPFLGDR